MTNQSETTINKLLVATNGGQIITIPLPEIIKLGRIQTKEQPIIIEELETIINGRRTIIEESQAAIFLPQIIIME